MGVSEIQAAVVYGAVMTTVAPVTASAAELYSSVDIDALSNLLAKQALETVASETQAHCLNLLPVHLRAPLCQSLTAAGQHLQAHDPDNPLSILSQLTSLDLSVCGLGPPRCGLWRHVRHLCRAAALPEPAR